ncbi:DUF2218 domain-containing protein [Lichenibacterium dinghuense]|uniref:DUF2218 domain-containing protein n=1 Tax=Lichenibacterium dinghuense TaxID=2895977 RepID=UPI001F20702A|nr:DUF2218 domain-containing protein [Lichenibacterium sp. 6Y81]
MPISEARVATAHGSRYLQQLCKHWSHKFTVDFTAERGMIDFGDGRACALAATGEALTLRATVPEGGDAQRFEGVIGDHLKRFAFREELAFDWRRLGD